MGEIPQSRVHFHRRNRNPWLSLLARLMVSSTALLSSALLVYSEGSSYHDANDDGISFLDAVYFSTVSLSTTGFGDIYPVTDHARLMNTIVITPLRFVFLSVLVSTTVEALSKSGRESLRVSRWRRVVNEHTIVIGYGIKGRTAVKTLIGSGVKPSDIVVITSNGSQVPDAGKVGCVVIHGDAHQEDVLADAVVSRAKRVVIALDADDTTVLVALAVRRMNPKARIVASVREAVNVPAMRQSGVDTLISTSEAAGQMLATSLLSPETGDVLSDLLDPVEGLQLRERPISATEVGARISSLSDHGELVLAVHRGGSMLRFNDPDAAVLRAGDAIIFARTV